MLRNLSRSFRLFVCLSLVTQSIISPLIAGTPFDHEDVVPIGIQNKSYTITPERGKHGTYEVLVTSSESTCATTNELSEAKLVAPEGGPIQVVETRIADKCSLTARIIVLQDALPGKVRMWVEKEDKILGIVEFTVTEPVPPGQIPVAEPQVDVMWSVLPKKLVSHNFGRTIASEYYAVEIIIGNNSAYNLQIVSVGFELPPETDIEKLLAYSGATSNGQQQQQQQQEEEESAADRSRRLERELFSRSNRKRTIIPTSSYRVTRGSLEAKHLLYPRTFVLSTITALGPLLTGFVPFFHNLNRRANFSEGINIFSNPLEKGLEMVWPDPRPSQRERFDDQVLRDGLVVRNNTQVRTLAFFPKELLRLPEAVETEKEYKKWRDVPMSIRGRLGELVLVGDLVQHVNRISVTPNPPAEAAASPVINNIVMNAVKQSDQDVELEIHGSNLQGANFRVLGVPEIAIAVTSSDPSGRVAAATMDVADTVAPGRYWVVVTTPTGRGSDTYAIDVESIDFQFGDVKYIKPSANKGENQRVELEIPGTFLHNSVLRVVGPDSSLSILSQKVAKDGKKLTAVNEVAAGADGDKGNKLQLEDRDRPNLKREITIEFNE